MKTEQEERRKERQTAAGKSYEVSKGIKVCEIHEWVREEGDTVKIGITDFAQESLGDLVFINLPEEGDEVQTGEVFADVESVKAVSDVYSPVSGVVVKVNGELADHPELVNQDLMVRG